MLPAALRYSRVRILGAPASIAAMVLQAACLGARDSVTPLGVVRELHLDPLKSCRVQVAGADSLEGEQFG